MYQNFYVPKFGKIFKSKFYERNRSIMFLLFARVKITLQSTKAVGSFEGSLKNVNLKLNLFNVYTRMEVVAQYSEPWAHI